MHRRYASRASAFRLGLIAGVVLMALPWAASMVRAASVDDRILDDPAARTRAIKQAQHDLLMQGARNHFAEVRARRSWDLWKKRHPGMGRSGLHARPVTESEESTVPLDERLSPMRGARAPRASALSTLSIPTNVRCNNPTGEPAGTGQAEESIASFGNYVLVAWNDGNGFNTGGDVQNYGYSTNDGATFIQGAGGIPHPAGATGFRWSSDPLVTVNEKTGEFYYAGLCDSAGIAFSGVGVVKATFPGGASPPVWGPARIARNVDSNNYFIDKEWMVADSSNGNLYLTYTLFTVADDSIDVQRSTNGGVTWGPFIALSSDSVAGYVQGSRPAVGPTGEVYVTWEEIGLSTNFDHFRIRKSTDAGVSFGAEAKVDDHYSNFGTGAPGFNRQSGITFPAIAVDRTTGPNRGRVYVTWNEGIDWFDDPLGGGGAKTEVESNGTTGTANAFTPGQRLRGAIGSTTDLDYFSFSATLGTTYIFWCDSLRANLQYTMRILCNDGTTRLSLSGADANSPGANGFLVWTAPTTATYYFRMGYNGAIGGYRVQTGVNGANTGERARDHRDIFVAHSDNGTAWATPTLVNDDVAHFDNWLPEIAVGGDGAPYVTWFDWRDGASNCGGSSNIYLSRSNDGGATWVANVLITSNTTTWTTVPANIAPNQGDYNSLYAGGRSLRPSWGDGRNNVDPDVWATGLDTGFDITTCKIDSTLTTGTTLSMTFSWANRNVGFSNDYTYKLTDDGGWVSGTPQPATLGAGASQSVTYNIPVPNPAVPSNYFRFSVTNSKGTLVQTCLSRMTVTGNVAVTPTSYTFGLRPAVPNPVVTSARIDFTLPADGPVKLMIFGLRGERVRTLVDGVRGAGPNSAAWDGRDDRGHRVGAGAYYYRLQGHGQSATRRLVMLP